MIWTCIPSNPKRGLFQVGKGWFLDFELHPFFRILGISPKATIKLYTHFLQGGLDPMDPPFSIALHIYRNKMLSMSHSAFQ